MNQVFNFVDCKLSPSSGTYNLSNPKPPELSLVIASNTSELITIFTWHSILCPKLALNQRRFTITDLTNDVQVTQTSTQLPHAPLNDIRGGLDDAYYLTIERDTPAHRIHAVRPIRRRASSTQDRS